MLGLEGPGGRPAAHAPNVRHREGGRKVADEQDQNALSELSRHYDNMLWTVMAIWSTVIGAVREGHWKFTSTETEWGRR